MLDARFGAEAYSRYGPYAVLQPAVEKVRFAAIVEIDCEATDVCFEFNGASHSHEPMWPPQSRSPAVSKG